MAKDIDMPKVSVVMPVFNGEQFVKEAVQSILAQTYTDFDFIIIDDGSTDRTLDILSRIRDSRIRLVTHRQNQGLIDSLNEGFRLSTGEYVARMDCDDVAHPSRLSKQVLFLDRNTSIGAVGSSVRTIGTKIDRIRPPGGHELIKISCLFDSPMVHPSVILRKDVLSDPVYDKSYTHAEDYELWTRLLLKGVRLHNLSDELLDYRVHNAQVSTQYRSMQVGAADAVRSIWVSKLGLDLVDSNMGLHRAIALRSLKEVDSPFKVIDYLEKLNDLNRVNRVFDQGLFRGDLLARSLSLLATVQLAPTESIKRLFKSSLMGNDIFMKRSFYRFIYKTFGSYFSGR